MTASCWVHSTEPDTLTFSSWSYHCATASLLQRYRLHDRLEFRENL